MTDAERREAARQFVNKWKGRGNEDQDSQLYWIDFLSTVVGMEDVTNRVNFEKKVIVDGHAKKIDVYIPETHVLIEQKSIGKPLDKKINNSGDIELTSYEQAKRYNDNLPYDEKAKWIVTSNFSEIWVYDMNTAVPTPEKINLMELQSKYSLFGFLMNQEQKKISHEVEISKEAGTYVGLLYDALLKQYINPESEESLKSLNMLCVRIVFCLYAEDAHIFGDSGNMFHDYLEKFDTKDMRKALIELFKILDTPEDKRDPYDTSDLSRFPYVNGGLFEKEDIEIPNFTEEIRDIILVKASEGFDWSAISPTIFGAVFESTLNPETRRSGGMHYTSIENIHKVIDPLFLDELKEEYAEIEKIQVDKTKKSKLEAFQNKLAEITCLDPACGSGNFLTETYISLRRLENQVIRDILDCDRKQVDGQMVFGAAINPIKIGIDQFYGIEINDFAVTVAKTALWIAESQMLKETEDIIHMKLDFLPLKTNAFIHDGNALRVDWEAIVPKGKLKYIMGNPPFNGARWMSQKQKNDVIDIFGKDWKGVGDLDYVCCWYKKAVEYIKGSQIRVAFVSTNSISQGGMVCNLWKGLFEENIKIDYAYRTFIWDSEASIKAHVHCVIIGFSCTDVKCDKFIYNKDERVKASNINGYLLDAESIFIEKRTKPISNVPEIALGGQAIDDGNFILTIEEKQELLESEPQAEPFIRRYMMGKDFIDRKPRYCIWLVNANLTLLRSCPQIKERIKRVEAFRRTSQRSSTLRAAETPSLFASVHELESNYIAIPKVSSENRRYVPMDFLPPDIIPGDKLFTMPDAGVYEFGIMMSNVQNAWMRAVCGRLKSDYSYSNTIVYNNFPWPTPTEEEKQKIEQTAQAILDARALYPDSSLADLYDPLTMPPELRKAHTANDKAVMQAYGFSVKNTTEADCVAALMKMYQELVEKEKG